jgi:hypothetical protein
MPANPVSNTKSSRPSELKSPTTTPFSPAAPPFSCTFFAVRNVPSPTPNKTSNFAGVPICETITSVFPSELKSPTDKAYRESLPGAGATDVSKEKRPVECCTRPAVALF